jgi:hypothetical protein
MTKVSASGESQYDDAFTIQMVEDIQVAEFNYVAGMVPFLQNIIKDVSPSMHLKLIQLNFIVTRIFIILIRFDTINLEKNITFI